MKKNLNNLVLTAAVLLFISCGGGGGSGSSGNDTDSADGNVMSSSAAKNIASCFEAFDYDYRKMLTQDDVVKHATINDLSLLEVTYEESSISPPYNEYILKWASGRPDQTVKIEAGGTTMEFAQEDVNKVSIDRLDFSKSDAERTLSSFNRAYGQYTEEEYREMEERIDRENQDKSEAEREQMKGFVRARENLAFQPVSGLGTAAYWERETAQGNHLGVNLYVLSGTVQFRIKLKVSDDDDENVRVAKLLAQEVLNKCE